LDNVEEIDSLQDFWALSEKGSILITSRHDVDIFGLATDGNELGVFSNTDGAEFLLKMIKRAPYTDEDKDAAHKLSRILDGLALALNITASQIRLRKISIPNFLRFYEKNSKKFRSVAQNEVGYRHSLKTCWATAFQDLTQDATVLLGTLSLIAPDDVPEAMFCPKDRSKLPLSLSFCVEDSWE
jgi:hypothetical protein